MEFIGGFLMVLFVDGSKESNAERSGEGCLWGLEIDIELSGCVCIDPVPNAGIELNPPALLLLFPRTDVLLILLHPILIFKYL